MMSSFIPFEEASTLGVAETHHFASDAVPDGRRCYIKEVRIPAGVMLRSHEHPFEHFSVLVSGKATVEKGGASELHSGYACLTIEAGVKHHVALSIVGTDRLPDSGYLRAKVAQEKIIREAGIPYTIVRSTQFMEFLGGIAQEGTVGDTARLSTGSLQPIASDDVADFVTDAALAAPANGIIEICGPERARLCDFAARYLKAIGDSRTVVADPDARYFGTKLEDGSLVSDNHPRIGRIGFDDWFATTPRK